MDVDSELFDTYTPIILYIVKRKKGLMRILIVGMKITSGMQFTMKRICLAAFLICHRCA